MINQVFFSPDGTVLFHLLDERVQIWTVVRGERQGSLAGTFVGLSHDGTICLTSQAGGTYAWQLPQRYEVPLEELTVDQFAYHQRVRLVASRGSSQFVIHDLLASAPPKTIQVSDDYCESPLQKTPTDRYALYHGSYDIGIAESSEICCFDIETGEKVLHTGGHAYHRLCFSPTHQILLVITGRHDLAWCDLPRRRSEIAQNRLAGSNYPALGAGTCTLQVPGLDHGTRITWASINPHDRLQVALAIGSVLQIMRIEDPASTRRPKVQCEFQIILAEPLACIEFHPDGERIACLFQSGTLALYQATSGKLLLMIDDRSQLRRLLERFK